MKKKVLILIVSLFSITASFAQTTKKDFVGYWTTNESLTECVIWMDKYDNFQYVEWDKGSGQGMEILSLRYENNKLIVRTRFKETNWVVTAELTLIDEYNMNAKIVGDGNTTIKYKKLK